MLRVDPNQLVTAMVAWLGAGVTSVFGAAVNAAAGVSDPATCRRDRDAAAGGISGCRERTTADRAAARADTDELGVSRTARAVRDEAVKGRLGFTAVALAAAEGLAEEAEGGAEVSSAWAVPAPASATPTPSATAPAPNHP
jgi:hypothetical protein